MFSQMPTNQRLGTIAAIVLLTGGVSYVGFAKLRPTGPLDLRPLSRSVATDAPSSTTDPNPKTTPSEIVEPAPEKIVVDVSGAVRNPCVVTLSNGSRVNDAIKAAGGPTAYADLEPLNLAEKLQDGMKIDVPRKGSPPPVSRRPVRRTRSIGAHVRTDTPTTNQTSETSAQYPSEALPPSSEGPISLNRSSEAQLEEIPGIGPVLARRIVQYRQMHGGFASVEQMLEIEGIGPKKFEKMRPYLTL